MNKKKIFGALFAGAAFSAVLSACLLPVGDGEGLTPNLEPIPAVPPDTNLRFVYDNTISKAGCASCHSSPTHESGVSFSSYTQTFNSFFNTDSTPKLTKELQTQHPTHRVWPNSLDSSYLWHKIAPGHTPKNGTQMPPPGNIGRPFNSQELAIIQAWILKGAPIK